MLLRYLEVDIDRIELLKRDDGLAGVHILADVHLAANGVAGLVAVVACDKPPVGTVAAVLENNTPAVILSDGPIRPGIDPRSAIPLRACSASMPAVTNVT